MFPIIPEWFNEWVGVDYFGHHLKTDAPDWVRKEIARFEKMVVVSLPEKARLSNDRRPAKEGVR